MKAIVHHRYGTPDVLKLTDIEKPDIADDGRLKRVRGRLDHQDLRRHRALGDWSIGCAAERTTATFRILHGSSVAGQSTGTASHHTAGRPPGEARHDSSAT